MVLVGICPKCGSENKFTIIQNILGDIAVICNNCKKASKFEDLKWKSILPDRTEYPFGAVATLNSVPEKLRDEVRKVVLTNTKEYREQLKKEYMRRWNQ